MYNKVTQQLVSCVLDNEQSKRDYAASEDQAFQKFPQAFLLIGENDTNLTEPNILEKPQL